MRNKLFIQRACLTTALALFIWSLFAPVWVCGAGKGAPLEGMFLFITGIFGLLLLDPRWFCNLLIPFALFGVLVRPLKRGILCVAIAAVGTTTLAGPYFCAISGSLGPGDSPALGAYLWVCSLWLFAFAAQPPWPTGVVEDDESAQTNA